MKSEQLKALHVVKINYMGSYISDKSLFCLKTEAEPLFCIKSE